MLRIFLILSLTFSLSLFSSTSYLYAKCRPGHDDGGGGSVSSPRGDNGGMSSAAGAAAGLGLLFNLLQATRAQEEDAEIDIDALAAEYAMAFNVIDPTAALIILAGVPTGVDIAAANPEGKPVCGCDGDGCKCPKDLACGGAVASRWDEKSGGMLPTWKWVCGGVSSGGTGVDMATTSSEDKPVCLCGGSNCTCPKEDACGVLFWSNAASKMFTSWYEAEEGSAAGATAEDSYNEYADRAADAMKKCNKPGGEPEPGGEPGPGGEPPVDEGDLPEHESPGGTLPGPPIGEW